MKKSVFAAVLLSLLVQPPLSAQKKAKLEWSVTPSVIFDNREYDLTGLDESRTLFGIRVATMAGVGITDKSARSHHSVLGGVDPLYEFGGGWTLQPILYYRLTSRRSNCMFKIAAGIFPFSELEASYSDAFRSSYERFTDDTVEGLHFGWKGDTFQYELGVDWSGKIGSENPSRREEFRIYSGGGQLLVHKVLKLGYSAMLHHYSTNLDATGNNVVDDILLNPYIEARLSCFVPLQSLKARLGYIQAFERDRAAGGDLLCPGKGEFVLEARKWNVGVENSLYFGGDLQPLYDSPAPEGGIYGGNLYKGDPFFRNADGREFGVYDRLGIYWNPSIARGLDFCVRVNFHFNGGFAGHQELISLCYRFPSISTPPAPQGRKAAGACRGSRTARGCR